LAHRAWVFRVPLLLCMLAAVGCGGNGAGTGYYPLDAGRWWYYAVDETVLDEHRANRYLALNTGRAGNSSEPVQVQMMQTRSADFLRARGAGVERIARLRPGMRGPMPDEQPRIVLPETLAAGTTWQVQSTLALIESRTFEPRDRIIPRKLPVALTKRIEDLDATVSAGDRRYEHCLLVLGEGRLPIPTDRGNSTADVSVATREWYAPNVGLVKLERDETSDSTFLKPGRQRWELLDHGG
jgi:hypothetical protein